MKGFDFWAMLDWYDWERDYWYERAEEYFDKMKKEANRAKSKARR